MRKPSKQPKKPTRRPPATRTTRTPKKEARFLDVLRQTANVSKAAQAIQTRRATVYEWRKQDADFTAAWDDAVEEGLDNAEGEAYRRAVHGTLKPVFYQGEEVGSIREYSDTLLIFLLKGGRPEKYRERTQTDITSGGAPLLDPLVAALDKAYGSRKQSTQPD